MIVPSRDKSEQNQKVPRYLSRDGVVSFLRGWHAITILSLLIVHINVERG